MLLSFAPINEAYAEYLKDLDISSWFSVKAGALDDIPSISCDIEWDVGSDEGDTSEEDMLNRSEINYMKVNDEETFSTYSSGSDYSNNATTYTVLLLDIESAHNMLTYNGEYLCTIGSPVEQVKAAALKLIDQIKLTRGTTHVAIVTFCQNVRVVQNFTTDYYTMRKAIENISADTAWTDVNGAFKKADELLSSVSEANADKNIVLFTQGVPYAGEYSSSGRYTINDCSWKRKDNNIYAYQYSNSAYATAEALKAKYNIYSVGLYQSYEGIPEQGQSMLNFAKRVNQDIQNKGYYDVTNVDDLEFSFSQDVFNLAVAIDLEKKPTNQTDFYIQEHINFINSNDYHDLMNTYRFEDNLIDADDFNEQIAAAVCWDLIGDVGEMASLNFDDLTMCDNPFTVVLADLITSHSVSETMETACYAQAVDVFDSTYDNFMAAIRTSKEWDASLEPKIKIEVKGILTDPNYKIQDKESFEVLKKILKGWNSTEIAEVFNLLNVANDIFDVIDTIGELDSAFTKAVNAYITASAFQNASENFITTLIKIDYMLDSLPFYGPLYHLAIMEYLELVDGKSAFDYALENLSESLAWVSCDLVVKKLVQNAAYSFVAAAFGCSPSAVGVVIFTYNTTYSILNKISALGETADLLYLIDAAGQIERLLESEVEEAASALQKNQTISDANRFDCVWGMMCALQKYEYSCAVKYASKASTSTRIFRVFNSNYESGDMKIATGLSSGWENVKCHGDSVSFGKICSVECPTNVIVKNTLKEIVLQIENDEIISCSEGIVVLVGDEHKYFSLPNTDLFDVEITGTNTGTMDYTITEVKNNNNVREVKYKEIPLDEDTLYSGNISNKLYEQSNNYNLSLDGEIINCSTDSISTDTFSCNNEDWDDDGLDNLTEYEYGTDPLNPDTDGDNVYDKVELLKGLDPLNPMTDGITDDYIVAYGAPDLEICEITFDDNYIYFSVKNDTDSKAMRTLVEARVQDETIALWTVNVDEHSIVQFAIDRTAVEDWTGLVLEADGGKLTHDSDYSNNAFTYSAANAISLEDTQMVKRTSQSFAPATEPDGVNDIYRWSITEGNCLTSGTVIGEFTANKIGKATIKAETLNGLTADCLISVVSFESAEYSEFDSELIDAGAAISIVGYIGDDEHVEIPDTIANLPVTEIGTDAFYDCLTMKSVEIPSSVVALGDYAFDSCLNLSSITIGSNIREIGVRCFYRCINLETVYYNSVSCRVNTNFFNQRAPFDGCSALEKCIISDDVIEIPQYLFYDLSSLKEVEMGNNVEYIGNRAFSSCDNLEYICLPETLTSIGSNAFYGCSSLSNLILPENLYSISSYAFGNCSSIYSAIIPDSVSSIGSYAFSGCTNLTDISITNDIATVYESSFDNTAYFNDESNWENGILYIDNHLITGKADLINGVIKSGTVRIANSAFADNTSLTRITIPKTVEIIGTSAFSNCTGLTSAVIPTSVEQIESSAFTGCTSLGQVSVYNKDCVISNSSTVFPETTILCGYLNSTTQEYATNFSRTFVSLHEHDYSYVVKVEPTVMNEGYIECSCSCGDAITEAIPAIAQNCIVKNNMLIGFDQGLSVEELLEKYLVSNTATITLSRNVIGTGTTVEIINGDGFCEEYEIVIIGDVNGDSWHDGQDAVLVSSIVNGMLSESQIGSAAYTAADCNADGKVDDQDVALLQSAGLMIDEIDQTNTYGDSGSITVTFNGNGATDGTMESQGFEFGVEQNLKSNEYSRSYKIAYELNGGVAAITNANTDSVYSFKSWNSTQNGNGLYTYSNGEAVTNPKGYSSGNAELYAQWIGGGVRIPTPTKEYNEFVGWYTDSEFKNEFVITDSLYYPSDNITLYAKWQPHEFEVTFNDVFDFDTFDFSSALNGTVSVDKENKSVTLYSETFDTHTTNYADSTRGYMTLIPGHTYRFSYDWENLSDVDDTLHPYAFAYDSLEITELQMYNYYKLPAPARSSGVHVFTETIPEGHPFVTIRFGVAGSEQGGSIIKCSNIHIQDITNLDGVADDVSVPMNTDGETIFNVSVEYGNKVSSTDKLNGSLPTIRRTGYTFAGWYDSYDENGNGTGNLYDENSVMGATDMKLYAKWIKEE